MNAVSLKLFYVFTLFFSFDTLYSSKAAAAASAAGPLNPLVAARVESKSDTFSLLTWNILGPTASDANSFLEAMERYKNHQNRLDDIIFAIFSWDPDILCLQEVNNETLRILNDRLQQKYRMDSWSSKGSNGGVAIFSKKDLLNNVTNVGQELKDTIDRFSGSAAGAYLSFVDNNTDFLVFSVHFSRANEKSFLNASKKGEEQLRGLLQLMIPLMGANQMMPIVIAGDFNTLYSEVITDYINLCNRMIPPFWNMYKHLSFTASEVDGKLASIDHVLYRGLKIQENSWVEGGLFFRDINKFIEKKYAKYNTLKELESPDSKGKLKLFDSKMSTITDPIKTYKIGLDDVSGDSPMINNGRQILNPSDHLPIYVTFKKPQIPKTIAKAKNSNIQKKEVTAEGFFDHLEDFRDYFLDDFYS